LECAALKVNDLRGCCQVMRGLSFDASERKGYCMVAGVRLDCDKICLELGSPTFRQCEPILKQEMSK